MRPIRNPLHQIQKITQLKALYLIAGDEPFLVFEALDTLKRITRSPSDKNYDWQRFSEESIDWSSSFDELVSPSLFPQNRVLSFYMNHQEFKKIQKKLQHYLSRPVKDQIIVIVINNFSRSQNNTLNLSYVKKLSENGHVINASRLFTNTAPWKKNAPPWDNELCHWIQELAHIKHALKINERDCFYLFEQLGNDPGRIANELEKIALYIHPELQVSRKILEKTLPRDHDETLERFTDALKQIDVKKIFDFLSHAENDGLYLGGKLVKGSEQVTRILLNSLQACVRDLISSKRFLSRHEILREEDYLLLAEQLGLQRIKNRSLLEKTVDSWTQASRKFRMETLLNWLEKIQETRVLLRQNSEIKNVLFLLLIRLLEKRLCFSS
jgi:DNA polymerase III delta subunit